MEFILRPAVPADCPLIARIQVDSYRRAYAGIFPPAYLAQFSYAEQTQDWLDWPALFPADILLVAETQNGEIAGYALARPGPTALPDYDCEVLALHLHASWLRQGVGSALFIEAARRLQALGCRALLVWVLEQNLPARRFYEKLGGAQVGWQLAGPEEMHPRPAEVAYGWADIHAVYET